MVPQLSQLLILKRSRDIRTYLIFFPFWYTTALFRPEKVQKKVRKFEEKKTLAKMGQIIVFSMLKSTPTWKKYTRHKSLKDSQKLKN